MQAKSRIFCSVVIPIFLLLFFYLEIAKGSVDIALSDLLFSDDESVSLILKMRLSRALSAIFIGASLAISGLVLQTTFSNPIAGPYVLGISSGASLGVALSVIVFPFLSQAFSLPFFSALGALGVSLVVSLVAVKSRNRMTVLLVGLMLSYVLGALISMVISVSEENSLMRYTVWTLGSLSNVELNDLAYIISVFAVSFALLQFNSRNLDILSTGDMYATTLGLDVRRFRFLLLTLVSLLTAVAVSFSGPIGFIGTASPHIARWIVRSATHKSLIPVSALIGSCLLLFSDFVSRISVNTVVIPINTITALFGVPIILYIILNSKNK
ncbi:MAG: iron ABC transporter permease [Paludibacteraceae bacterium]|nr:iron ABC transporter permease [Paludibacteraceae bacterium]